MSARSTQSAAATGEDRASDPLSLPRAAPHAPRGVPRASRRTRWRVATWIVVHALFIAHFAHWKIAGTTLTPVEPSEAGETLELGYVNAGFLLFAVLILATLVFGRFFCGWACHVVAYQDAAAWVLAKLGLKPRPVRSRLLAFVPAFAALQMFVLPLAARFLEGEGFPELSVRLATDDLWVRFPGPWIAALTFFVDGALLVWLLGAKGFCTYACPYGAAFGVADRVAPGRIRVTDACEGCGHCTATCTSNVRVHEEVARFGQVVDANCMKCMDCVDVCPKDALYFGFTASRAPAASTPKRPRRTWDFSWPEEALLAAVFAGSLWAWRGLYGAIPFLLALGLAVLAAFATVAIVRAARGAATLQGHTLRRDGRLTGVGALTLLVFAGYLGLTVHSALVRHREGRAEEALLAAEASVNPDARAELVRAAEADLEWLVRNGLVSTADQHNKLGSIRYAAGDLDGAADALRAALDRAPELVAPRVLLADVQARRGAWTDALDELERVLDREPAHPEAARRLAGLAQSGAAGEAATARAAELLERARRAFEASR